MARRKRTLQSRIRAAFDASPLTYDAIAGKLGIPKTNVYRQINGQVSLSPAELRALGDALGVSLDGLEDIDTGAKRLGAGVRIANG